MCLLRWRKQKRKLKKWKRNKNKNRIIVFLRGLWRKCWLLLKWHLLEKIGKHYLCSEEKKRAFPLQRSVFGKWSFFVPIQSHQTLQNQGFSRHREKPQMALLVAKVPFWEGALKGVLLAVLHKSCVPLKTHFHSVFSKAQLSGNKRVSVENKKFTKIGKQYKEVFFWVCCLGFLVVLFFSLCFCAFVCKMAQRGNFLWILELCFQKCSLRRPAFKILLFFLFCLHLFCFPFVFPFKIPFFPAFCPSSPFWKTFFWGGGVFFCLSFSCLFLPIFCLFLWNKLS